MSERTIYVSHTSVDAAAADRMIREVIAAGLEVASNKHTISPGLPFDTTLRAAVASSVRFVACFSGRAEASAGYEASELLLALERIGGSASDPCWFVPVRLTPCDLPALPIGTASLRDLATVDLYGDWQAGIERLLAALPQRPRSIATASNDSATARLAIKAEAAQMADATITNVEGDATTAAGEATLEFGRLTIDRLSVVNVRRRR